MDLWYLLFSGISPDGMGEPSYVGRTTEKELAKKHFDEVDHNKNPYSTGKVMVVSDYGYRQATKNDFSKDKPSRNKK